ncbi:MAG: bifunctional glutamate N-acetyltransferase/amino-acid acetyltransferase ArgJ [Bacteroidetes bacterium]|nr:bifunctional glutamate N-acetyltransferase/amino-acid acetyltransferase ArgJ [Bacteroidota bacterium]
MELTEISGGVTAALGFVAGGMHCGIRKKKLDLAILRSKVPASVAGVFTMNKAQAAPIIVDKLQLKRTDCCSAIVVNSGNANACTGERGLNDAWHMVRVAAAALGVPADEVLVSSTGVIGQYLPIDAITDGIAQLVPFLEQEGGHDAAEAIMTTDTFAKEFAVSYRMGGKTVTIGSMAKGSGMIAPNMATVLGFVATDAAISTPLLQQALSGAIARSFNRVSVDGDTSTNDMVIALANGESGAPMITEGSSEYVAFYTALEYLLTKLAKMIARDGEGATKLIEVVVRGAATEEEAEIAARAIANSNLVKTAIHGEDANWGRIIAAVGYSGIEFDPEAITIVLNQVPVLLPNYEIVIDEDRAKAALASECVVIEVNLGRGSDEATFWTCDLSKEYVHINASYRS